VAGWNSSNAGIMSRITAIRCSSKFRIKNSEFRTWTAILLLPHS
jgi:hypothetical protein